MSELRQQIEATDFFDTLLFVNDQVTFLDEHIERTLNSLKFLGIAVLRAQIDDIYKRITTKLRRESLSRPLVIRLDFKVSEWNQPIMTIRNLPAVPRSAVSVELIQIPKSHLESTENYYLSNPSLTSSIPKIDWPKLNRIKWSDRSSWDSLKKFQTKNAEDFVLLDSAANVIESSIANVFVLRNNVVLTPPLSSGCLAGTFREYYLKLGYIELLDGIKYPLREETISSKLLSEENLFLGNSVRGLYSAHVI